MSMAQSIEQRPHRSRAPSPAWDDEVHETEPLLDAAVSTNPSYSGGHTSTPPSRRAVVYLLLQHLSSTLNDGLYNFAAFLFLIEVYLDTLVPASLVGFFTKAVGLIFSGHVGGIVDRVPRLAFVRRAIGAQKVLQAGNYALFLILFGPLRSVASAAFHARDPATPTEVLAVWTILGLTIACSALLGLANTGITVAVERDWVMTIADGDTELLTMLNTYMRRIDLLSKLCAPLIVSIFATLWGYTAATGILLALSVVTAITETLWIGVVHAHFPALAQQQRAEREPQHEELSMSKWDRGVAWARREKADWAEFVRLPVFGSSVAIAAIYLTTLSYDGTFIAYVKAGRGWDDNFIALMRGVCVLTGLMGTAVMPLLERRIGLERAGAWSIWFEAVCLALTLVSFFYGAGQYGKHGPAWNSVLLFGGIALSRIGLWSFDLCQLKVLQLALDEHPRRNRLTALQIALQDLFDFAKYAVTLAAASPARFKWTALVSYGAVVAGGIAYCFFLRAVRGHLFHLPWGRKSD